MILITDQNTFSFSTNNYLLPCMIHSGECYTEHIILTGLQMPCFGNILLFRNTEVMHHMCWTCNFCGFQCYIFLLEISMTTLSKLYQTETECLKSLTVPLLPVRTAETRNETPYITQIDVDL